MSELLQLDFIEEEKEITTPPRVRLVAKAYPSDERGFIFLTQECPDIGHFEQAVDKLRAQIDTLVEKAREAFQLYESEKSEKEVETRLPESVEEIWQAMEKCETLEEMQGIFNSLEIDKRKEVADFILTEVNIFKGAASIFSQHYNEEELILE